MDEVSGPYKVVSKFTSAREPLKYSIVRQHRNDVFLQELIPDAGSGDTARRMCNLLNKNWKEDRDNSTDEAADTDGAGSPDGAGI